MASDQSRRDFDQALLDEGAEELYEEAPCGYLSTLPDGLIVRINQTLVDWVGHSRESLLGRTRFQALLPVGSKLYYETHYAPLLRMQGAVNAIAFELLRADGRRVPVLVNARQKRDPDGTPLFNRITLFDATDRRRYERELLLARRKAEQAAKDKAELVAMLSHDIRNPLNALMGVVQLLELSELTEVQRRWVRILRSSSGHMLTLLDHVLELSRAESITFAAAERLFALTEEIDAAVAAFDATAREKRLVLGATLDPELPAQVVGDPVALRQILSNLVGNAVKFTSEGRVDLTARVLEHSTDSVTVTFAVTDTGIGIAPDEVQRIFDEFAQATPTTRARFGGTGLGLSITRKLLALYGSSVRVNSAPGQGSTFSFDLRFSLRPAAA